MKHLSKWIIHKQQVPLECKECEKLLFPEVNWEGFRLGLELDFSMAVDLEKSLWRMYQVKEEG